MKLVARNLIPDVLLNPISRNLILIFVTTLFAAAVLVSAAVILFDKL